MTAGGQRVGFFEHRGHRVAYATLGSGDPLLCDLGCLHHLDVFWRHPPYRRLVETLGREFTVIRLDRPGCGLSDRSYADFTLQGELALFGRLMDHLGLEHTAVLAAGTSARVMIATAALRPERVSRLAVFGAWPSEHPEAKPYLPALRVLLRTQVELAVEMVARWGISGSGSAAAEWLAGAYLQTASGEVIAQWMDESFRMDVRPLLGQVRCPTLVLHRRDDRAVDFLQGRDVAAGIPGATLLPLDGASNRIWEGNPEPLLRAVVSFLSEGGERGAPAAVPALTSREQEVTQLVALGLTDAEIAGRLRIGRRTVESHVARVRGRLGLSSRAQLAAWSIRARLGADPL